MTILSPAHWELSNQNDAVDLTLLPRRYLLEVEKINTAAKRPADAGLTEPASKRARDPSGPSTRATSSKAVPRLEMPTTVWAGIDL